MTSHMQIEKHGVVYTVHPEPNEPNDVFYKRMWIIANQVPQPPTEYETAVLNSVFWKHSRILQCQFSDNIEQTISKIHKQSEN